MTPSELRKAAKQLGVLVETLELARSTVPVIFRRELRDLGVLFPNALLPALDEQVKLRGTCDGVDFVTAVEVNGTGKGCKD